jgi:SAM-dependent methyltransferase
LRDYVGGKVDAAVVVHVEGNRPDRLPVRYFFRDPEEMGPLEAAALSLSRGRILDLGACAGAHSVPLTQRGLAVTALDILPAAASILRQRGVPDVRQESVWSLDAPPLYDTLLALMNGTSLAGTLGRLEPLLRHLRALVAPGGQLLIDSTDLGRDGDEACEQDGEGEGELHYQLEYGGRKGAPFPQLFVGEGLLADVARITGWAQDVVAREGDRYLARLVPRVGQDRTEPAAGRGVQWGATRDQP